MHCGEKTVQNAPARYSPEHRMSKYRRVAKKEILEKKGLL
jgi:rRNA maturation protein Nop10